MPTDLCRYCGSTYDLVHGHTCTPTITVANTGPAAVAGPPPDLQQAIHAATKALHNLQAPWSKYSGPSWRYWKTDDVAKFVLEATTPFLLGQLQAAQAENQQLRDHILDIDAHATPYGDLPDDPGYVGSYLVTAGALHRALGKLGHTAPSCTAEVEVQQLKKVDAAARAYHRAMLGFGGDVARARAALWASLALEHQAALGQDDQPRFHVNEDGGGGATCTCHNCGSDATHWDPGTGWSCSNCGASDADE